MKLIRMAILFFHMKESDWMSKSWMFRIGDVDISSQKIDQAPQLKDEDQQGQLVFASIELEKQPDITSDKYLIVPKEERRKTEYAIETTANLFAVVGRCQREITSPMPCIAFLPETDEDAGFLESLSGIYPNLLEAIPDPRFNLGLDEVLINSLSDRLSGVALLAEALAHKNATGKYHEFVRLYELAFLLPITQLDKRLSQFLSGTRLGYTRNEIKQWVDFRHQATHADLRKTQKLVFEADIVRYIPRMEQAAYDLLLNKAHWQASDAERRDVWTPDMATTSSDHALLLTPGGELQFQLFDPFKSYSLATNKKISSLPEGFWSK